MSKVIVVGGGAAGMMAAVSAALCGHQVSLYEKNEKLGKKIFITGKGRCNLTNDCTTEELLQHVVTNPKFLYSAFYTFDNQTVRSFFEENGCPLKVERGKRVFPVSDRAGDVVCALEKAMRKNGVNVCKNASVEEILVAETGDTVKGIRVNKTVKYADAVILATGGCAYPGTGSTGDGYSFAEKLGHTVKKCLPALVPFYAQEAWVRELQGLSLRNCSITLWDGNRKIYEDFGELLFTHFGVSGPTALCASSYVTERIQERPLRLEIDLKPALSMQQLDERILRDFERYRNKNFIHALCDLLPASLIPVTVSRSGILPDKKVHEIRKEERRRLACLLKKFDLTLTGLRGFSDAIITHGGINVKEIDPATMESKRIKKLYFAGELIDVDAVTGGFNLQIAWSTGYLAGKSIE